MTPGRLSDDCALAPNGESETNVNAIRQIRRRNTYQKYHILQWHVPTVSTTITTITKKRHNYEMRINTDRDRQAIGSLA